MTQVFRIWYAVCVMTILSVAGATLAGRNRIGVWMRKIAPFFAISWLTGCASMESLYEREALAELAKPAAADSMRFDGESLARLPFPVRRHLESCGWAGRQVPANARIRWEGFRLKRGPGKAWMDLDCRQFNSTREPMRLAYMGGRLVGFIPFEGRDKFQNGHGHMLVKAMDRADVVVRRKERSPFPDQGLGRVA